MRRSNNELSLSHGHWLARRGPVVAAAMLVVAGTAHATVFVKADNTTALNLAGSYTTAGGPPGAGDQILVSSTMAANRTALLGADLSIDGIILDSTATRILTISGSNKLTLGASGILIQSASPSGFILSGPAVTLSADQTWNVGSRGLQLNAATSIDENGKALVITGAASQIYFHNGTSTLAAQITGSLALTLDSSPGTADLTVTNAASTFNAGAAVSEGSTLSTTSMRVGAGTSSALGVGQITLKGGTLKYAGSTSTTSQAIVHDPRYVSTVEVTTAGQTLTVSTFNNANSSNPTFLANGVKLGGLGNLTLTDNITESTNANKTATTLNKIGAGTLTLQQTVANTYTGATTVTQGSLVLASAANLNSSASVSVASGATFTNNSSVSVTRALTLAEGAVLNGSGAFAPASVTVVADLADGLTAFNLGSASLTKAGTLELTLANLAEGSYQLYTGGTATGTYASVTIGGTPLDSVGGGDFTGTVDTYTVEFSNATNQLVVSVPEPASLALAMLGGLGLLRRSRKQ